jgi:hypothetical protein
LIVWLAFSVRRRSPLRIAGPKAANLLVASGLIVFLCATFAISLFLDLQSGFAPIAVSAFATMLCVLILISAVRTHGLTQSDEAMRYVGLTGLFIAATPLVGIIPSTLVYVTEVLRRSGFRLSRAIVVAVGCCALQLALLAAVFDVLIEREIIGRALWNVLGY